MHGDYRQSLRSILGTIPDAGDRGFAFEKWFAEELCRRGLMDARALRKSCLPFDVVSDSQGIRIQCKYTTGQRNTLDVRPARPIVGSTVRRYRQSDFEYFAIYFAYFDELYIFASADRPCPDHKGMINGRFSRSTMQDHLDNWPAILGGPRSSKVRQRIFAF